MGYAVMLTGAGPTRAHAARVTHVAHLVALENGRTAVLPFPAFAARLTELGVHHAACGDQVAVRVAPPREYVRVGAGALLFALAASTPAAAEDACVAWCRAHAA